MFLGLRSLVHPAPDLAASTAFYTAMLGKEPYFDEPFYVGYSVGGFELGLWPDGDPTVGPVAYWGVDNIDEALAHVVSLGATARGEIVDVGGAIRMIEVCSPTGDVYGLIENPGFLADPPPACHNGPGR
jgi:catechol 2,3-dioxygenase-like lactoylglutathione lyase family enzyme